jgi:hypothetical protein
VELDQRKFFHLFQVIGGDGRRDDSIETGRMKIEMNRVGIHSKAGYECCVIIQIPSRDLCKTKMPGIVMSFPRL